MPTMTVLVDGTVPVAADYNGNFSALNAAIGSSTSITSYTTGDLPYASAANTLSKLAIGTEGDILTTVSGIPAWAASGTAFQGLVGLTLSNDGGSPNTVLDIAAGVASSDDATYSSRRFMTLGTFTKNMNAAWVVGSGNGGLASGASLGASTWYHAFIIKRTDTNVVDVMGDTSVTGANIPANYTKKRRIGSFKTDGSSHIITFIQDGDLFQWLVPVLDLSTANPGTSAVTLTLASVPTGVNVRALLNATISSSTASAHALLFSDLAVTDTAPGALTNVVAPIQMPPGISNAMGAGQIRVRTNTSAQVRYRCTVSDAGTTVAASTFGYEDRRGQDA